MPRAKGTPKTGGRTKGTLNRKTVVRAALVDKAIAEGETPLEFMLKIMRDEKRPPKAKPSELIALLSMRFEAAKAAAPYVHPKPTALPPPKDNPEEYARKIRESVGDVDRSMGLEPSGDEKTAAVRGVVER